jgi:hypothetical protein
MKGFNALIFWVTFFIKKKSNQKLVQSTLNQILGNLVHEIAVLHRSIISVKKRLSL